MRGRILVSHDQGPFGPMRSIVTPSTIRTFRPSISCCSRGSTFLERMKTVFPFSLVCSSFRFSTPVAAQILVGLPMNDEEPGSATNARCQTGAQTLALPATLAAQASVSR